MKPEVEVGQIWKCAGLISKTYIVEIVKIWTNQIVEVKDVSVKKNFWIYENELIEILPRGHHETETF